MPLNIFVWTPFPYAYFALYSACIFTAVVVSPNPLRRLFFVPLIALSWRLLYDGQAGYLTSQLWFGWLPAASDYILLTDVQREFHRMEDSTGRRLRRSERSSQPIEHSSLFLRIKWALDLFLNARGIGWAHAQRHLRTLHRAPRATFLALQIARLCTALLLSDLANLHARWNPAFCARLGMASAGLAWRVVSPVGWAVSAASAMSLPHYTASIVSVALGLSRPQDWPPLFGGLADVVSVRKFWARGWHQLLRRSLSAHGKWLSATLRLSPRSRVSLCVHICTAFFLSGLVHYLGERVPLRRVGAHSGSLVFFGIQPVGIALETLFCFLATKAGAGDALPAVLYRALGLVWVLAWFALTLPIMQDPLIRAGELDARVDVSLIMRVWRGSWRLAPGQLCPSV